MQRRLSERVAGRRGGDGGADSGGDGCGSIVCPEGTHCDGAVASGCETELGTDADCGGCGDRCTGFDGFDGGRCRCTPDCAGAACGDGTCPTGTCPPYHACAGGRCVCHPDCADASCNADDGCGGRCSDGWCPINERCGSSGCHCPPGYDWGAAGACLPSCGTLLRDLGYYDDHGGCCSGGCAAGFRQAGGPGATYDRDYCCEGNPSGSSCS